MSKKLTYMLLALVAMACTLTACFGSDEFKVKGTIVGNKTMNIRFVYPGDNVLNSVLTAARDGQFEFVGNADKGAVVQIMDNDFNIIGYFFAENGDKIELTLDDKKPYKEKVKGNEVSERWAQWLNQNADVLTKNNADKINELVKKYVKANPNDILSAILITQHFDATDCPNEAEKLMSSLSPDARRASIADAYMMTLQRVTDTKALGEVMTLTYLDSHSHIGSFSPRRQKVGLLCFSNGESGRADSILPELRRLSTKRDTTRLRIIDFSMENDTLAWKRTTRTDSATWTQCWAAGSITAIGVNRLAISRLPYFIVVDSTGAQKYRGRSIHRAGSVVDSLLKK